MGSATTPTVVGAFSARNIVGDTTGTAVPASYIGQILNSVVTTHVTLSTGILTNITSLSLTAGNWLLSGTLAFDSTGTATESTIVLSAFSGITTTDQVSGDNRFVAKAPTSSYDVSATIPNWPVTISATTTYYLKARMDFSSGTNRSYGRLTAVRIG